MKVTDVRFIAGATSLAQAPSDARPQVAIIGPSNVGKSSLLNALVGRKGVARVSRTPGRTQQLNFFLVNERFYLVDLPGYGFADAPRKVQDAFLRLVESYLAQSKRLRLLIVLLDCRRDPSVRDEELLRWLRENEVPHAVVLTKADKLSRSQLARRESEIGAALALICGGQSPPVVSSSAATGDGRKDVWAIITRAVAAPEPRESLGSLREPNGIS